MKKFISGLLVGALLMGTVTFAAPALTYVKSAFTTVVHGKTVKQDVVTIKGVYYANVKQLANSLGVKYTVDAKSKCIVFGESPIVAKLEAKDYYLKLKSAGLSVNNIIVYTAESDTNKLLGRPNQYTSKVNFADTTLEQEDSTDPAGGSIEVFKNNVDAKNRKAYIDSFGSSPLFTEYSYINGNTLLRLNNTLTPDQAEKYKTEFMKIK